MAEIDDRLPDDSGSQGNETIDGLDSATEALRRATEGTASGAAPRGMPPKIRLSGQPKHALVSSIDGRDKCQTIQRWNTSPTQASTS
jgi:hypothetical protein